MNAGTTERTAQILVDPDSQNCVRIVGKCDKAVGAMGSCRVRVPPLNYIICRSGKE